MRVLYLSASGAIGGAERSLLDVLASLRDAKPDWRLHLVAPSDGPLLAEAASLGVEVSVVQPPTSFAAVGETGAASSAGGTSRLAAAIVWSAGPIADYLARLRAAIDAFGPHIVHSNGLKPHLAGAWVVGRTRPLVWHLHDYIGSRTLSRRLLKWAVRHPRAVIASSRSVAQDAERALGARVKVVPVLNGIDLDRFSPTGATLDLDGLAGLPPAPAGSIRVGLVATFARWKGQVTFLEAIARLPKDVPVRAYIIGGPVYETAASQFSPAELKQHAERLGLGGKVGFTGFVSRSDAALRALDIVVHASTAPEPFGLVILEAMACERAVIVSDTGGAKEIFSDGVDALAHTPGSAQNLSARIAELALDKGARVRLGHAGRLTAERRFHRARLAADLVPVYERAAAEG